MALPIVVVKSNGIAVTEASNGNLGWELSGSCSSVALAKENQKTPF
jgi:hypothetical protein